MIYYFSGTGNSYKVAAQLAQSTSTKLADMSSVAVDVPVCDDAVVGFVLPVYAWGLPVFVEQFVKSLPRGVRHKYVYAVLTCGDDMGYADVLLRKALKRVGWQLDAVYVVQMRNTYVCLPGFDVDSPDVQQRKDRAFGQRMTHVAACVASRAPFDEREMLRGAWPWLKSYVLRPLFNKLLISDRRFSVDASVCSQCGACVRRCPLGNMRMGTDGLPQWHAGKCTHCLRCYHICPHHAISYGKFTRGKGQVKINL